MGFSPDRMLQGCLFSYGDTQRYRLGVNHYLISVNAPKCPFHAYHRDGAMRVDGNYGARPATSRTSWRVARAARLLGAAIGNQRRCSEV
ncbi:catalase [Edaphobacter aggregans]|uniref:catalase n=1 Tax=Edaphobacter aggregans TaxID=570835 RepID=UPI003CCBFC88